MSPGGQVAILGDGTMGTTLAATIAGAGRRCTLWCADDATAHAITERQRHPKHFRDRELPAALTATGRLEAALDGAALIIIAVGSPAFRETARRAGVVAGAGGTVLSATKGIELYSLKRMTEVAAEEFRTDAVGTIGGANVTPDIMAGQLTALVVASRTPAVIESGRRALETPRVRVVGTRDLDGAEFAGILKNAIALAMGIATGLGWGDNTRSLLLTEGLAEIRRLGLSLGSDPDTFYGLCGLADLFLTSTSSHSLNYTLGVEVGRGKRLDEILRGLPEVPEGLNSTRGCVALADRQRVAAPIGRRTLEIVEGTAAPSALEGALIEALTEAQGAFH